MRSYRRLLLAAAALCLLANSNASAVEANEGERVNAEGLSEGASLAGDLALASSTFSAEEHEYDHDVAAAEPVEVPAGPLAPTIIGSALSYFNLSGPLLGYSNGNGEETDACGASVQQRFNCSEAACEDLVPGYINYLDFFYCDAPNVGARIFAFLLLLLWGFFLLHLVESTTNDFFCASLTLAVDALKLSPNVAGVTFLAVGNAACDVIASIAAFATNSPKVGVGTTLGAGIFVTCAVIAVVSFVSDVRLARRSFVRDLLFFIVTVIYLLIVHWDGVIDIGEAAGFIVIYVVFVGIVAGGRYIRMLRNHPSDEAVTAPIGTATTSATEGAFGLTGDESHARRLSQEIVDKAAVTGLIKASSSSGYGSASSSSSGATLLSAGAGSYNSEAVAAAAGLSSTASFNAGSSSSGRSESTDVRNDMLAALDAARSFALSKKKEKQDDPAALASSNRFAPASPTKGSGRKGVEEEDDGDDSSSQSSYDDDDDEDNDAGDDDGEPRADEEEGGGDLGGGSGHPSTVIEAPSVEDGGMASSASSPAPSKASKKKQSSSGLVGGSGTVTLIKAKDSSKKGSSATKAKGKKGAKKGDASAAGSGSTTFMDDLPKKPSRWTRQFLKTQKDIPNPTAAAAYQPFQWTKYHKKQLAVELGNRLRARGVSIISTPDGRQVDFIDLLTRDPKAAGELAAAIGTAVTAAAQQQERALSYAEASAAADSGARAALLAGAASGRAISTSAGDASGGYAPLASSAASAGAEGDRTALLTTNGGISSSSVTGAAGVAAKSSDYLSILPHETIKPIADCYLRMKRCMAFVSPFWHGFMTIAELPVTVARKLTVPVMHEGAYRRRLICLVMPFSLAFFTLILTTHILKGSANTKSGFPLWLIGFFVGGALGVAMHFFLPLKKEHHHHSTGSNLVGSKDEDGLAVGQSLLASSSSAKAATVAEWGTSSGSAAGADASKTHHHHHHQKKRPWYKRLGIAISGPNDHPLPKGPVFAFLLLLSFLLALFWLLVIANEIVGTALFIGKVLKVPDVVMGLTVLAVGNSINDLAASLTIARDGYASMAVAGAYAGPMFNVLAGIGLPMLLACSKAESRSYDIGKPTLLTFLAYGALLTSLTVTLVWVPFEQWRITHRIGRFLCAWFFLFVGLVVILGFAGVSKGDVVVAG